MTNSQECVLMELHLERTRPMPEILTQPLQLDIVIVYDICDDSGACIRPYTPAERAELTAEQEADYFNFFKDASWHATWVPHSLVETTAPAAYDYHWTVEIDVDGYAGQTGTSVRTVAIPVEKAEYQIGRYQSGLHCAKIVQV